MSVAAVALTILVYRRSQSPLLASLTFALSFAPYVLGGGLLSGAVDRVRPRRLVTTCDLTAAMTLHGIGFALAGAIAQASGPGTAITLAGVLGITTTGLLLRTGLTRDPAGSSTSATAAHTGADR